MNKYELVGVGDILPPTPHLNSSTRKSISKFGVLQSILVKPLTLSDVQQLRLGVWVVEEYKYRIIKGERVFADAITARLTSVPCVIVPSDTPQNDLDQMRLMLAYCTKRNTLLNAFAARRLLSSPETPNTIKPLAQACGIPTWVLRGLSPVAKLPEPVLDAILEGRIKDSVISILTKLTPKQMQSVLDLLKKQEKIRMADVQKLRLADKQNAVQSVFDALRKD
jgi:hypothetical protein